MLFEHEKTEKTVVVAALVARIDVESWSEVKRTLRGLGGEIVFQKVVSPDRRLWIVERGAEASI